MDDGWVKIIVEPKKERFVERNVESVVTLLNVSGVATVTVCPSPGSDAASRGRGRASRRLPVEVARAQRRAAGLPRASGRRAAAALLRQVSAECAGYAGDVCAGRTAAGAKQILSFIAC